LIPLFDVKTADAALRAELLEAAAGVLDSGRYILGPEVERFESEFARAVGAPYAVGVSDGTRGLQLALEAVGVGRGDEVILPAVTFIATATAVSALGARPIIADVSPESWTLDPQDFARRITARTRAVVPVHLYGWPADMDPILETAKRKGVKVVADCAQAHGALYKGKGVGALGHMGCYSFYPTKNLGAAGDAGMLTTGDPDLNEACRLLRNCGRKPGDKYLHARIAGHSRLDELQAAFLRVKLRKLDDWVARRRAVAARYREAFQGLPVGLPPDGTAGSRHAYHLFILRAPDRDNLSRSLAAAGIDTGVYYPVPVHLQPAYEFLGYTRGDFPVSEKACEEALAIPVHPALTDGDVDKVASAVRAFYKG